jgi:tetrahydrodipicolinate N-succinyltransferase
MPWRKISLNNFQWLRRPLLRMLEQRLRDKGVVFEGEIDLSLSAVVEPGAPGGITFGGWCSMGPRAHIDARLPDGSVDPIVIGACSFIGSNSVVCPGVTIGPRVIVAAGAVVTRSVPSDCIVAGNPARVVRRDVKIGYYGILADESNQRLNTGNQLPA